MSLNIRNFYQILGMMLKYLKLAFFVVVILTGLFTHSCNTSKTYAEVNDDEETDIKDAKRVGHLMYKDLVTADSIKMMKWIKKSDAKEFVSEIKEVVNRRPKNFGALNYFEVFDVSTHCYRSNKGDTLNYKFYVKAYYDYLTSEDWFALQKIGKQDWKIIGYDFSPRHHYSCGYDEIENLEKNFQDFSYYLAHQNKSNMRKAANCSEEFLDTLVKLSQDIFGIGITTDTVTYIDGYFKSECGSKGYASGFMIYEVEYNDTSSIYLTYSLTRSEDEEEFFINTVYTSSYIEIDNEEEIELLKLISKDLWSLIKKKDSRGLYEAFHEELKDFFNNKNEVVDLIENYAELGVFEDFLLTRTFNTQGTSVDDYAYYISVLELKNDKGETEYLEMVFKPEVLEGKQKFMLHSIRELY